MIDTLGIILNVLAIAALFVAIYVLFQLWSDKDK